MKWGSMIDGLEYCTGRKKSPANLNSVSRVVKFSEFIFLNIFVFYCKVVLISENTVELLLLQEIFQISILNYYIQYMAWHWHVLYMFESLHKSKISSIISINCVYILQLPTCKNQDNFCQDKGCDIFIVCLNKVMLLLRFYWTFPTTLDSPSIFFLHTRKQFQCILCVGFY